MKGSFSSRNTRASLIGLIALGVMALALIAYNLDKWLAGGAAVRSITETCNIVGSSCSSAFTSIFQIITDPSQLLLSLALAALLLAVVKAGAVLIAARKAVSHYKHSVKEFPRLEAILRDLDAADIPVKIADDGVSAFTYGVFRPVICLSSGLINRLSDNELAALMAHEVGHIRRRDNLAIFLALFIRDFLWPFPVTHYLFTTFIREKEYAADDFAVRLTGEPLELASAIVSVAKAAQSGRIFSPSYATFFSNQATAKTRVRRLLSSGEKTGISFSRFLVSCLLSALIVAAAAGLAYAQPFTKGGVDGTCEMGKVCIKHDYACCE